MLNNIAPIIRKLVQGNNLSSDEVKEVFTTTSKEDNEGYYYLAFATSIMAKGITEEELFGIVQGLQDFSINIETSLDPNEITDLSGSGGDRLKTFNISTAASFITAAAGVKVAKQSFIAFNSFSGSSDIQRELGISLPQSPSEMVKTLIDVGFVPLNYPYIYSGMDARLRAVAKFKEIGLMFPTPMHPIALVPSPIKMKKRTYGIFSEKYMLPICNIFQKLGYQHGMIMYGKDGLDEISNIGITRIIEFFSNKYEDYEIKPQDLGLRQANPEEIVVNNKEEGIISFIRVLYGKDGGPKEDLVCANAGASLFIMEKAASLKAGIDLARNQIYENRASTKLEDLIKYSNGEVGLEKLSGWKMRARI